MVRSVLVTLKNTCEDIAPVLKFHRRAKHHWKKAGLGETKVTKENDAIDGMFLSWHLH